MGWQCGKVAVWWQVVESLYGQDLDSGHHGSGFPLPPFRQRLLEAHLAAQVRVRVGPGACESFIASAVQCILQASVLRLCRVYSAVDRLSHICSV